MELVDYSLQPCFVNGRFIGKGKCLDYDAFEVGELLIQANNLLFLRSVEPGLDSLLFFRVPARGLHIEAAFNPEDVIPATDEPKQQRGFFRNPVHFRGQRDVYKRQVIYS